MFNWNTKKESIYPIRDYRSCNFSGDWTKHFFNEYVDSLMSVGLVQTEQKLAECKNEHLPESLFKFYPQSNYSLDNIKNQTLFLSSPRNFNDPFDSYVCIDTEAFVKQYLIKKIIEQKLVSNKKQHNRISEKEYYQILNSRTKDDKKPLTLNGHTCRDFFITLYEIRKKKSDIFDNLLFQITKEARAEYRKKIDHIRNLEFKISCFSNFKDDSELLKNSTMWSHYADNHSGFCVKYKINFEKIENRNTIICGLMPVKYTSQVHKISIMELMKMRVHKNDIKLSKALLKSAFKALTTKSAFWKYENEWRLIINSHNSSILSNNSLKFLEIEEIFLGCRIDPFFRLQLVDFATSNDIKIFQTNLSYDKFELSRAKIDMHDIYIDACRNNNDTIQKECLNLIGKNIQIEKNKASG